MPEAEYNQFTVIILVNIGKRVTGLVVDAVSDVLSVGHDEVQAPPEFGASVDMPFMIGMARVGERLVMLIYIERLVGCEDITLSR